LGMLIRLKKINVPPEAKFIPFGQKRMRGRPAKANSLNNSKNFNFSSHVFLE